MHGFKPGAPCGGDEAKRVNASIRRIGEVMEDELGLDHVGQLELMTNLMLRYGEALNFEGSAAMTPSGKLVHWFGKVGQGAMS